MKKIKTFLFCFIFFILSNNLFASDNINSKIQFCFSNSPSFNHNNYCPLIKDEYQSRDKFTIIKIPKNKSKKYQFLRIKNSKLCKVILFSHKNKQASYEMKKKILPFLTPYLIINFASQGKDMKSDSSIQYSTKNINILTSMFISENNRNIWNEKKYTYQRKDSYYPYNKIQLKRLALKSLVQLPDLLPNQTIDLFFVIKDGFKIQETKLLISMFKNLSIPYLNKLRTNYINIIDHSSSTYNYDYKKSINDWDKFDAKISYNLRYKNDNNYPLKIIGINVFLEGNGIDKITNPLISYKINYERISVSPFLFINDKSNFNEVILDFTEYTDIDIYGIKSLKFQCDKNNELDSIY